MSGILKLELKMLYVLLKDIGKRIVASLLEYPQFLMSETSRMPDSIGRDAFSEVK